MAEIVPIVSESLEAQIRNLLPSQRGFGEDLQASNVITPIIDLTAVAEGSTVPQYQAQALAFGSQTAFLIENTTTVLANTPGFYRVVLCASISSGGATLELIMSDGLANKTVWSYIASGATTTNTQFDAVFFLRSGDTLSGKSDLGGGRITGSLRQVADVNGNIVNPVGFTPQ